MEKNKLIKKKIVRNPQEAPYSLTLDKFTFHFVIQICMKYGISIDEYVAFACQQIAIDLNNEIKAENVKDAFRKIKEKMLLKREKESLEIQ